MVARCSTLNSLRPTIKFTMESEEEGSLPFLDTRVTRLTNGKLDISVYRKKTHTDRYLHFESHHPTHVKRGTVRCLYDRARNITQRDESLKEEESHLMKTFIGNGYLEPSYDQPQHHEHGESLTTMTTTRPRSQRRHFFRM